MFLQFARQRTKLTNFEHLPGLVSILHRLEMDYLQQAFYLIDKIK
jgi:hypothetical protein